MTTNIEQIELTEEQKIERETFKLKIAFIKGILCGYAKRHGMRHETTKPMTPAFEEGFKQGQPTPIWMINQRDITGWHILYNQIKGKKPHTGDVKKDAEFECERNIAEKALAKFMEARHG